MYDGIAGSGKDFDRYSHILRKKGIIHATQRHVTPKGKRRGKNVTLGGSYTTKNFEIPG